MDGEYDMKIKYTTLIVKDMEESIKFYRDGMGFEIDSKYDLGPAGAITLLKGEGETMVEIIQNPHDEPGLFSIGMDVEDLNTNKELKAKVLKSPGPHTYNRGITCIIDVTNGARIALIQKQSLIFFYQVQLSVIRSGYKMM